MYYTRTQAEQEFYDWLVTQPPPALKQLPKDDPLERLVNKEKRLDAYIKRQQRKKRNRQKARDATQLTTKEVGECLAKILTANE